MVYEPLHHKYRPQTFADLVGQGAIAMTLSQALHQQRIAPAYLFCGPRGTGKTSSARILAKSLNCLTSADPTDQPCGLCEVCRAIAQGTALDVIEIDAASNTGVENIRDLIERSQFAPVQSRYKVYVIDECHMLSSAAFNALLKTLEEPPERVVFILATTDPQRVLPTIISRCQRFDFRRIPLEAMAAHLHQIASLEAIQITDEAIALVAQIAQGGLRDAESLLDQLSLLPDTITPDAVWDLVGAVPERDLLDLAGAIAQDQAETVLDQARKLMNRGREPLIVLQSLAGFYRDLLIAKTAPNRPDLVAITEATWPPLCHLARQLDLATLLHSQQYLRSAELQVKNTTQPRLWLEVTLLGLLPAARVGQIGEEPSLATTPAAPVPRAIAPPVADEVVSAPPPPTQDRAIAPAPSPPPLSETNSAVLSSDLDLAQIWQRILSNIELRSTQMLLRQQGQLERCTHQSAVVRVTNQWLGALQKKHSVIAAAFERVLGQPIEVRIESGGQALQPQSLALPAAAAGDPSPLTVRPPYPTADRRDPSEASPTHPPVTSEQSPPPAAIGPVLASTIAIPDQGSASLLATPPPSGLDPVAIAPPVAMDQTAVSPAAGVSRGNQDPAEVSSNDWDIDPGLRAAQSLAQFFNGDVVSEQALASDPATEDPR